MFAAYLSWLRAGNLSEGTVRLRLHHLEQFARAHPDPLDTSTEAIIGYLENQGWKPATMLSVRSSLKS